MEKEKLDRLLDKIGEIVKKASVFDKEALEEMNGNLDRHVDTLGPEEARELLKFFIKGVVNEQAHKQRMMSRISKDLDGIVENVLNKVSGAKKVPVFDKGYQA